jgi:cellulose biosynthesis protein BcsQ
MKLLAVMSHKGGVGKTTSAVVLAEELAAKGYRTLLVDADRQQGAGLLLEVGPPTGDVQRTRVPGLDYLGSGKFTEADVAAKAPAYADRYDIGIVDTPAVDDDLARSWLQQANATLMIMQVEPLTVKTFPSALATLETVRRLNPLIELVGLLPTMFDASEATHRTCLTELLTRRPESVFTPPVPSDAGLMHRGAGQGAPEVTAAARQAYQCAADRIIRVLGPSRSGAAAGGFAAPQAGTATTAPGTGGFPANGAAPSAGWQPASGGPPPNQFPTSPAQPGWGAAPAAGGFPAPGAPPAFPEPAPASGWPAQPGGFAHAGGPPAAPPGAYAAHPVPPAPPAGFPPSGYPAPAGAAHPGWPAHPGAHGASASAFDADEREPDWYRGDPAASAPAVLPTREGVRKGSPLPFLMGFAAACILALLVWAVGSLRKPAAAPANAAPATAPAGSGASTAPKGGKPGASRLSAPGAETKTAAAPYAAAREEA